MICNSVQGCKAVLFPSRAVWCRIIHMKYLKFMLGVMLVLLPVLVYVFWPGAEAQIKKAINSSIEAAQNGDAPGVMANVSLNYHDDHGMSYLYLRKIVEKELERYSDIKVEIVSLRVRVIGEKAFASLQVRVIATGPEGRRGYWLGDIDNPFFMELEMKNEKPRGWKVYSGAYGTASAGIAPDTGRLLSFTLTRSPGLL